MKKAIFISLLFLSFRLNAQEINIGGGLGYVATSNVKDVNGIAVGAALEFLPKKSIVSFNTDPFVLFNSNKIVFTEPIYLKLKIGNTFRVCPTLGAFVRTSPSYGWSAGLNVECRVNEKLLLFMKGNFDKDFWKEERPLHEGGTATYRTSDTSLWFSVGIKRMLKN